MDIHSVTLSTNSLTDARTVSPSQISTYRTCPKQHYYKYTLGLQKKGEASNRFDKGNYFHELCHVYYRYIQEGVRPGSDTALRLMKDRISKDVERLGNVKTLPTFSAVGKAFDSYVRYSPEIDMYGGEIMKVLGVEEEIHLPIILPSGRYVILHGFIDLRYELDGQQRIRDHKTDSSGQSRSFWEYGGVDLSPQFLLYNLAKWLEDGVTAWVEVNYILTKDYAQKVPTPSQMFGIFRACHSEVELQNYYETTCQLLEEMLDSKALPHYDEKVCKYCPFQTPCMGERMGIPADRILASHYESKAKPRERTLTLNHSD